MKERGAFRWVHLENKGRLPVYLSSRQEQVDGYCEMFLDNKGIIPIRSVIIILYINH